jgi:dolichol-phosphate mannosyltransferase
VCTTDADGTCPIEIYPALVKLVEEGADVAIGSPWHPDSAPAECSLGRGILSRGASLVYRLAAGRRLYSWTSIARAYRRTALVRIPFGSDGFDAVAEILLGAAIAGLDIREIPMKLGVRRQGRSKMNLAGTIGSHLVLVAHTAWASVRYRLGTRR